MELELPILRTYYKIESFEKHFEKLILIPGLIFLVLLRGLFPTQLSNGLSSSLSETIIPLTIFGSILVILLVLRRINKQTEISSLKIGEKQILITRNKKKYSIEYKDINTIKYLYTNIPKEEVTIEKEKHWITIICNDDEYDYEFYGDELQNELLMKLEELKQKGLNTIVETII